MTPQIKTEVMTVTPEMATLFLENNEGNRSVSASKVAAHVATIQSGAWKLTHQGIAFSPEGRLLDGQHRLMAIKDANQPVQIMVTWNIDDDAFAAIDGGWNRSLSFRSGLDKAFSDVCAFFLRAARLNEKSNIVFAHDIQKIYSKLADYLNLIQKVAPTRLRGVSTAPIRAALLVSMIKTPDPIYSLRLYRMLVLADHVNLPPIGHSVTSQVAQGYISSKKITVHSSNGSQSQLNAYTRMRIAFDVKNKFTSKLTLRQQATTEASKEIKDFVIALMNGEEIRSLSPIPTVADFMESA